MQQLKFARKGNVIFNVTASGEPLSVEFRGYSINAAKRKSRELQGKDLGRGILRVE